MTIGEKMGQILYLNKIDNFETAGEKLGCTRQHISNIVKGEKTPSVQFINSFCYVFDVNKDWLVNENNVDLTPFISNNNLIKKITSNYMLLSEASKNIVDNLIDGLLELNNNQPSTTQQPVIRLAVYDQPVCAGNGNFITDATKTFKDFPNAPSDADFVVRVQGDSMTPVYNDGDLVFIKSTDTLNNGDDGIFIVDGEITLKRFMGNELIPLNTKYPKISQKAIIQGKVVGIAEHHSDLEAEVLDIVNQDKPQNLKKSI